MMDNTTPDTIDVQTGEITSPLMVYTAHGLIWGNMLHNENILATRTLTGVTMPEFITLSDAQFLNIEPNYISPPASHQHIHVPTATILGYHLTPPHRDQLDYDHTEPNRKMVPVTLYLGALQARAVMRIASVSSIRTTLGAVKASFVSLYDLEIYHPNNPKLAPIRANLGYFRVNAILVAH